MTSSVEFTGKTVDAAIESAVKKLGVEKEKLDVEILSKGSTGIFGLVGARKAKVRVRKLKEHREQKKKAPAASKKKANEGTDAADSAGTSEMAAVIEIGRKIIEKILDTVSPESVVSVENRNSKIRFNISGGDSGILIGKRGQTLDAIQYITEKIINKQSEKRVRIQIDVEGYLENRKINLKEIAGRMSEKVKRTGKPVTVGHMTAHDRRIVHMALKNDNKVRTQSLGDGFLKKLVIFPKRSANRKKKSPKNNTDHTTSRT